MTKDNSLNKEIAARIKARRRWLKLTQIEVALAAENMVPSTYTGYELGRSHIPPKELVAISRALQTSVGYLFGEEDLTLKHKEIADLFNKLSDREQRSVHLFMLEMTRDK